MQNYQRINFRREKNVYRGGEKMKRFVFRGVEDLLYYGIVWVCGQPTIFPTQKKEQAIFHLEHEIEIVSTILKKHHIVANLLQVHFVGNYKPTKDIKIL